jgi:hypothetical protein
MLDTNPPPSLVLSAFTSNAGHLDREKTRPAFRASYELRTNYELATWENVLFRTPTVVIAMLIWAGAPPVDSPATIAGFLTVGDCEHATRP